MTLDKPLPVSGRRERLGRRQQSKAQERREMMAAKTRDRRRCRVPGCDSARFRLRIDACHLREAHRGMGGNPDASRTTRQEVITLCLTHHAMYDGRDTTHLEITPLTYHGFSGPCEFHITQALVFGGFTGLALLKTRGVLCRFIGRETAVGIPETRKTS